MSENVAERLDNSIKCLVCSQVIPEKALICPKCWLPVVRKNEVSQDDIPQNGEVKTGNDIYSDDELKSSGIDGNNSKINDTESNDTNFMAKDYQTDSAPIDNQINNIDISVDDDAELSSDDGYIADLQNDYEDFSGTTLRNKEFTDSRINNSESFQKSNHNRNVGNLNGNLKYNNKKIYAIIISAVSIMIILAIALLVGLNKKDSNPKSDTKDKLTEKASSVEDNTDVEEATNGSDIEMTTEAIEDLDIKTTEAVIENAKETTNEAEEELTEDDLSDYDGSITIEYLDSAPAITNPVKKIPIYNSSASSMLEEELDDEKYLNYPFYMFDGDDNTSWQEGVEGTGSGERAGIYLDGVFEVNYICFKLGNWTSDKWYKTNPRPKTLTLDIDGEMVDLSFPDGMQERWVKIENAPTISHLYMYLGEVYPGTEYEDTCINEIEFYGTWYDDVDY